MDILRALKEMSKTLNEGTDVTSMLTPVLTKILQVTSLSSGWIFLIDQKGSHTLVAEANLPEALTCADGRLLKKGGCWCKRQFLNGELTSAVNMLECQRLELAVDQKLGDTKDLTHHATIPIHAGEQPIGILNVASPGKIHFKEDELNLLETIGYQIGTAIKRVQLYEQEATRAEEYSQLSSFLQRLHTLSYKSSDQMLIDEFIHAFQLNQEDVNFSSPINRLSFLHSEQLSLELRAHLQEHLCLFKERQRLLELEERLTQQHEREKLAHDLHDSVNQLLFSLQLRLKGLSMRYTEPSLKEELRSLADIVQEALKELKEVIQVRRSDGEELDLSKQMIRYGQLVGVRVELLNDQKIAFSKEEQKEVYRIVQEAINNTKKHAGTEEVQISLHKNNQQRKVMIMDAGRGFDDERDLPVHTIGLKGIKLRAEKVKGVATLTTKKGIGTTWEIIFPGGSGEQHESLNR
ncbi:GAF domain-containing sensor histidine kinase [Alkalihalobacillus sp. NPDC078783]